MRGAHTPIIIIRAALQINPEIFTFIKNWQIYSVGAHFQEAKGEGGRGEVSSPFPFSLILLSPRGKNGLDPKTYPNKKNQKTEVPKSYSILIPHRKGEGAKGKGVPWGGGGGDAPQPGGTFPPPLNSCPRWDKPGGTAFKNSPRPNFIKTKEKQNFPFSPQPKYIYIFFFKKQKFEGIKR